MGEPKKKAGCPPPPPPPRYIAACLNVAVLSHRVMLAVFLPQTLRIDISRRQAKEWKVKNRQF